MAASTGPTRSDVAAALPITNGLLGGRLVPTSLRGARRPHRILERHWFVGRSGFIWILLGGFFEPFFYLISTQLGFGSLIDDIEVGGQTVPYVEFVAPALLAASAMNGAMYETMNVFFRINFDKTYAAMLSTPMTTGDVVIGDTLWATIRGGLYSFGFIGVMVALGMTSSWWAVLLLPASLLVALAFGSVGMTIATYLRSVEDFEYVPTIMLPLFLFSATFFPASTYGDLDWVLLFSPLYHGVALLRGLNVGDPSWAMLGHAVVLLGVAAAGTTIAGRRIERALLS